MADLYSDNNVAYALLDRLESSGHSVLRCRHVSMEDAKDHEHLWYATQHQRIMVTCDTGFEQWNEIWVYLARVWNVGIQHPGILIVPSTSKLDSERTATLVHQMLHQTTSLSDQCFRLDGLGIWHQARS
jgi:hypothetical protein